MSGNHEDLLNNAAAREEDNHSAAADVAEEQLMAATQSLDSLNTNRVEDGDGDDGELVTPQADNTVHDVKVVEDGGKEDMFVDCPDELISVDGRISTADNSEAVETPDRKGHDDTGWNQSDELGNVGQVDYVMDELEHMRSMLGKTVGEKEDFAREYEAERRTLIQELAHLRHKLSSLNTQKSSIDQNEGGFVDYYALQTGEGEKMSIASDAPLQGMIHDCSKFIESALDERAQTEDTIRELRTVLYKKDQEIEELNARVAESSVLQDIEATASRVCDSLASAVYHGELLDESVSQKMSHIESSTLFLIEKYNNFLYGADLLRHCITNVKSEHLVQGEVEAIFLTAREELLELRSKDMYLTQKVKELEDENWKQVDQLNKYRETVDTVSAEIEKLRVELDHEKARSTNTKEKLSLAVTKGKALVQQRDSLKQSLADKMSELEKCLIELQEKSSALEAAELRKEELDRCEKLAASLQEALSERNIVIEKCEEILFKSGFPEELQSMDIIERVKWLALESGKLMDISIEFQKVTNALASIDFPESMQYLNLESRVSWLSESFFQAKEEAAKLQDVISKTREAATNEIDGLTASILAETQEKLYLLDEFEDLKCKYEGISEKHLQLSLEKNRMVKVLHEASGIAIDGPEEMHSDMDFIIERCFEKLKEKSVNSIESDISAEEIYENLQVLLYTRVLEAMLFEKILEEDMLNRLEVNHLTNKIVEVSRELSDLKDEKETLKNDLSRSEEKATLLREKLSLAVKKGKGLVQERESMKQLLDKTREDAHDEIDRLIASILVETQEKNYLQEEFEDLRSKYEGLVEKEHQMSLEKDRMVRMLHEKSGITMESTEELHSDVDIIVDRCFGKLKDQASVSMESSRVEKELLERVQSLLYTRDQEATLYKEILEEDMLDRSEVSHFANKVVLVSQELQDLKTEKDSLQNDLSLAEEKATVLREKLSAAVKKGKGLVQERESMKLLLDRTSEAAHNEIDRLTTSILAETQEKDYLQVEVEDLRSKYEGIVEKERQISLEKDQMVRMLYEASGIAMDSMEEQCFDMDTVIGRCLRKFKEQNSVPIEFSLVEKEILERVQCHLYIRDQDAVVCEKILEEDGLNRSDMNRLANELEVASQELRDLKNEKDSLLNDLSRSEEKAALLREKLSMAVKKGKGLFQERENLKQLIDEKNSEIQKLKLELEQQELTLNDFRDEINKLSSDSERIPKLDVELIAVKEQRDQLERFLDESNRMLQRLIESVDSVILPDDLAFEEPVEKLKWLAGYLSECQTAKAQAQQELEIVKDEASALSNNLAEVQTTMKLLADELSAAKNNIAVLVEERREVEATKILVEQELHKAMEKASSETLKFSQVCASSKSLEDELALAESRLAVLTIEKEHALDCRAAAEMELQKVKEEAYSLTSQLADARKTITSLEDTIFQAQTNLSLLAEENKAAQVSRTHLENEIKNLKEEADSYACKLADALSTVKSLQEAILKAESTITYLRGDKEVAAQEIVDLNARLNACLQELAAKAHTEQEMSDLKSQLNVCMQELAGTSNNRKISSSELYGYLNSLELLLRDETLLSLLKQSFVKKIEGLKDIDHLLKDIMHRLIEMDSPMLNKYLDSEENPFLWNPAGLHNFGNTEMVNGELNAADADNFIPYIGKIVDYLQTKNKSVADVFASASSFMDESIASLSTKLVATRDELTVMLEHLKSLKQNLNYLETDKLAQGKDLQMLENNITVMLTACSDASRELEIEVSDNRLELGSVAGPERPAPDVRPVDEDSITEPWVGHEDGRKYLNTADKLLSGARIVQKLVRQFQYHKNTMAARVEDLQDSLKESNSALEKVIEERDFHQSRVFKLESDLEASKYLCSELKHKLDEHQAKEDKWKEREAEFTSIYAASVKEKEAEDSLISTSQLKSLFKKIDRIEMPVREVEVGELKPDDPDHVKKLFHIIDCVDELQRQISSLSHNNEMQQFALKNQVLEIENLKEEAAKHFMDKQDYEKMKRELFELAIGLESIVQKLGGDEKDASQKSVGVVGLLTRLEKLVTDVIWESENSKSKAHELDSKMLRTQEVVDELTSKIKLLEDSKIREASADSVQERSVFEAHTLPTQTEISEVEDVGPLVNIPIPSAPSNAHVRTLRKGSSDHLAINIDSESDRLINKVDKDEDKGHAFKSLNTSGLVPRQGRILADRIDGIWVSGDRALMSRPRARLGLIAYWLFLNLWLLGTIL